jgi:hypothetical protein
MTAEPTAPSATIETTSAATTIDATGKTSTIEVRAQSGLIAAIAGAAERSLPVADGVAVFDGLADGIYRVALTAESAPVPEHGAVAIGTALQIYNGGTYELHSGDHAVVTCDESACTGVMAR